MAIKTMNTNAASFEAGGVRRRTVQGSEWRVVGAGQWVGRRIKMFTDRRVRLANSMA